MKSDYVPLLRENGRLRKGSVPIMDVDDRIAEANHRP